MQRYFLAEDYQAERKEYALTDEAFHHAVRVMRMKTGDQCYLVFQNQLAFLAEITEIESEIVKLKLLQPEEQTKELPIQVTIASAYLKGDKMDLVIQKATELGAAGFISFPGKFSVAKWEPKKLTKKQLRFQKIAQEAAEQSQRQACPKVMACTTFQELVQQFEKYDQVIVAYEEAAKQDERAKLVQVLQTMEKGQKLLVIFGPEGGLSPEEVSQFEAAGGQICGLGPRILRAETAPFYLLSAVSYQWELLG